MTFKMRLQKPDGRSMTLYGLHPIDQSIKAPSPSRDPVTVGGAHLRWHALRGEWVAYAGHRQNRTFLPPKEFNPLAPSTRVDHPTELPEGTYDVAVFDNMFPALVPNAPPPPSISGAETRGATGACEVVVFAQDAETSLGALPTEHVALILEVWGDRYLELGARPEVQYVMPFENRGVEVGVTLHHPHGQIYAYPFVPPIPAAELLCALTYFREHGQSLVSSIVDAETNAQIRMIYDGLHVAAFVPVCARYPYEVWIAPRLAAPSIAALTVEQRFDLAKALRTVLLKYDALWGRPFPYLMVIHQAPTDGALHPEAHVRFELCPAYRSEGRLKYLAGTELGAGLFANDSFPEDKARELRAVEVRLD